MKKILLSVVVVFVATFANAQLREKGTIELIPQIGYASSNYYGEDEMNNSYLSSVAFGVGADYFVTESCSLRSG